MSPQVVQQATNGGAIQKHEGVGDHGGLAKSPGRAALLHWERPSDPIQQQFRPLPGLTTIVRHMRSLPARDAAAVPAQVRPGTMRASPPMPAGTMPPVPSRTASTVSPEGTNWR